MKESNTVFRRGCARREHSYVGSGRGWDGTESGFDSEQSVVDSGTVEEVETTRAVTSGVRSGADGLRAVLGVHRSGDRLPVLGC